MGNVVEYQLTLSPTYVTKETKGSTNIAVQETAPGNLALAPGNLVAANFCHAQTLALLFVWRSCRSTHHHLALAIVSFYYCT